MKKFLSFFIFFSSIFFCHAAKSDEILKNLGDVEKVSQLFLVNVEDKKTYRSVEFLDDGTPVIPGGVLLFSYNIGDSAEELISYTDSIFSFCKEHKLFSPYVAVDQEGGEVNRLAAITSALPSCKRISEKCNPEEARKIYSLQAEQMKMLGIQMNLAPVAEPLIECNESFLSRRSFGTAEKTIVYATECVRAYEGQNVATVVKHFPGNSNTDPHVGLPVISMAMDEFNENFLLPFAFVLGAGNSSCVLMSHAIVRGYGEESPACLSRFWIQEMLKKQMGYEGLVISDDIFMGALADNGYPPETAIIQAIDAGVDVIMLSEKKFLKAAMMVLEEAEKNPEFKKKVERSVKRVLEFKMKQGLIEQSSGIFSMTKNERIEKFRKAYEAGMAYEK